MHTPGLFSIKRHMRRGFPALVVAAMLVAALIAVPILSVTANLLLTGAGETASNAIAGCTSQVPTTVA